MSKAATFSTAHTDRECLESALVDMYGKEAVAVSMDVITVKVPGTYGRVTFSRPDQASAYKMTYDSMDRKGLSRLFPNKVGNVTIDPLSQAYSKAKVLQASRNVNGSLVRNEVEEETGQIRIRIRTIQYGM
jgi:hypothetical protein